MHPYHVTCFTILFFLLVLPLHAMAQESPAPSLVTQDGYTIVEYYDFDFANHDWFNIYCHYKVCDCYKCDSSTHPKLDKNGKHIPIKRNHERFYLTIHARCTSDLSRCEYHSESDATISDASFYLINADENCIRNNGCFGYIFNYKKEGNKPKTNMTEVIQQNKKKGFKHHYAMKTRVVNSNLNSASDSLSVRMMCPAKWHKKTKAYKISDDCKCFVARGFSPTDYLITGSDLKQNEGVGFICGIFDDDRKIIDYARQFFK